MTKIYSSVIDEIITDLIEEAMRKYNDSHINDAKQDRRDYLKGYMDAINKVRTMLHPIARPAYSEDEEKLH